MGAYSPAPIVTPTLHERIMREVIHPTICGLAADGTPYTGFLYAGLMIAADGTPNVLEYNCRFGDPETQPVLARLRSALTQLCAAALDGHLDRASCEWDSRAALGVVLAAAGYPDAVRRGDVISGLESAAKAARQSVPRRDTSTRGLNRGNHHRRPRTVYRRSRAQRQRRAGASLCACRRDPLVGRAVPSGHWLSGRGPRKRRVRLEARPHKQFRAMQADGPPSPDCPACASRVSTASPNNPRRWRGWAPSELDIGVEITEHAGCAIERAAQIVATGR